MMKSLVLFAVLLFPFISMGQGSQPQGSPSTIIQNKGAFSIDSLLIIPYRDTTQWYGKWGNLTIRPQDNKLYVRRNNTWSVIPTSGSGSQSPMVYADTFNLVATKRNLADTAARLRNALSQKEDRANKAYYWNSAPYDTSHYASTEFVRGFVVEGFGDFIDYAFKRTIDSIKITGNQVKYVKLYRKAHPFTPNLVDSFVDNNTTYAPGWGLLLNAGQFIIDTTKVYSAYHIDSLIGTTVYQGAWPIQVNNTNKVISHTSYGWPEGTYTKVKIDAWGHVKEGDALAPGDIPPIPQSGVIGLVDTVTALRQGINGVNVNSITFTGSATKTLTLTKSNGSWIQASFTDNDNQTLSLSNADSLSISGGNTIHLPYLRTLPSASYQSFTGSATNTLVLPTIPAPSANVLLTMNNAWLDPADWSLSGATITLSFTTSSSDLITVYYSN